MGKQRRRLTHQPAPLTFSLRRFLGQRLRITSSAPLPGLVAILLLFSSLAILYSIIVPLTQGEDELAHYRYISFIAQKGRLPINEAEREQAWYRSDWPPLYHLLVGWAVSPLDTTQPYLKDVGESPKRRLVGEIFYPRLIIYTEDVNWPWQDGILAWHIGRFISIFFAAGALVFTYLTVREIVTDDRRPVRHSLRSQGRPATGEQDERAASPLLPSSEPKAPYGSAPISELVKGLLPLTVTALLAFTPRYLFSSAMLGDDSLFICLSAVFIWLLLRVLRGEDRWWIYALMGLLLGLSIVTKYSTGLLPLVLIPVVWWRARHAGWGWSQAVGRVALTWLFTLIGASWWFGWISYYFNTVKEDGLFFGLLRPLLAAGPDVSMRRVFAFFGGGQFTGQERPAAVEAGSFGDWLTYLFQTFWGVPVLEHDPLLPWAYLLLLLFCLLALAGLWQLWRRTTTEGRVTLTVLALIIALLSPFPLLRYFLTHNVLETGQGRHILYPAAQAIPLLLVLGWTSLSVSSVKCQVSSVRAKGPLWAFYVLLLPLLLLLWSVFLLNYMVSTYPAPLPVRTTTFNPAAIPQPLKQNFGPDIQLLGYDFVPDPSESIIYLTLFWQALGVVEENYRTQVQLVDGAGQASFTWLSHPLNGRYPTRAWDKGDVIRDTLPLPLAAVPPNNYMLQLNLLHEAEDKPLVEEAFQFIQIPLRTKPPIPQAASLSDEIGIDYRLWLGPTPVRQRQMVSLSWTGRDSASAPAGQAALTPLTGLSDASPAVAWRLLGPDGVPRPPVATGPATVIFIVGTDWPSGAYRLQAERDSISAQTAPVFTVASEARMFSLPPLPEDWIPVEANFAHQVKLSGYTLPVRRVQPGGNLPLTLYWQSLAPVLPDLLTFAVLLDAEGQAYGQVDRYPAGFYSPILWAPNEVVIDSFSVPVDGAAPPGVYFLHVGQYHLQTGQPESLTLVQAGQPTAVVLGPIKVGGPPAGVTTVNPTPQVELNQSLGGQITLLGYDLTEQNGQPIQDAIRNTQALKLTLYWRADVMPMVDYTTFFHLRDANNGTVRQKDSPPAAGRYPTSLWETGEIIVDDMTLSLTGLPPGDYTPVVGLYELATGNRLAVPGAPANEVALESLQVKE